MGGGRTKTLLGIFLSSRTVESESCPNCSDMLESGLPLNGAVRKSLQEFGPLFCLCILLPQARKDERLIGLLSAAALAVLHCLSLSSMTW
jgi:hypothetical protein